MGRATVALPRIGGTVYRAAPAPVPPSSPLPDTGSGAGPDPVSEVPREDTGSLTGQVLAGGRVDRPAPRARTALVVLVIGGTVLILIMFGLTVAAATSDAVGSFFDLING